MSLLFLTRSRAVL